MKRPHRHFLVVISYLFWITKLPIRLQADILTETEAGDLINQKKSMQWIIISIYDWLLFPKSVGNLPYFAAFREINQDCGLIFSIIPPLNSISLVASLVFISEKILCFCCWCSVFFVRRELENLGSDENQ